MRVAALALLLGACTTERAFEEPSPSLQRMVRQPRVDPYEPGAFRHPPAGTVPHEPPADLAQPPLDAALLARGRDRFERTCLPCHGALGRGDGPVASNMRLVPPADLHLPRLRAAEDARLFQVIREGYGLMPSYATALSPRDAWAVVAWVRALQLSQGADLGALPPAWRAEALRRLADPGAP